MSQKAPLVPPSVGEENVLVDADGTHVGSHNYFWKNNKTNKDLVYVRAYNEHPEKA